MSIRKIIITAAAILTLGSAGTLTTPAVAQDVDVYIDIPGFGRMPGYEYGGRRYISCRHGARIVDRRGFSRVRPFDCNRPNYRFGRIGTVIGGSFA